MKSILMSIQPKWVKKIINGEKTIDVRKTAPKEVPFKVYVYCTEVKNLNLTEYIKVHSETGGAIDYWHGKVVAEFICDKVETIPVDSEAFTAISKSACLTMDELIEYCSGSDMYGLHITDLKVYDEPKALHHFFKPCGDCSEKDTMRCTEESTDCRATTITRPPQSWQYVETPDWAEEE